MPPRKGRVPIEDPRTASMIRAAGKSHATLLAKAEEKRVTRNLLWLHAVDDLNWTNQRVADLHNAQINPGAPGRVSVDAVEKALKQMRATTV